MLVLLFSAGKGITPVEWRLPPTQAFPESYGSGNTFMLLPVTGDEGRTQGYCVVWQKLGAFVMDRPDPNMFKIHAINN